MKYIIMDLEWNGAPYYVKEGYFNEIIEIGAVKLDENLQIIDTFRTFVRPVVHKKLTGRVKRLTHISNEEIRRAKGFVDTYRSFCDWVGEEENCFLSYGTGDLLVLLENFMQFGIPQKLSIMDYYCDLQEICKIGLGLGAAKQPGLSAVAEELGIDFEQMSHHRALDDCKISVLCLQRLWNEEVFKSLVSRADAEFIRKLTFKSVYISDMENPLVDKSLFDECICPQCQQPLCRISEMIAKNRNFTAEYHCDDCDVDFIGRHTFRLKYEGVQHKCSIRPKIIQVEVPEEGAEESGIDGAGEYVIDEAENNAADTDFAHFAAEDEVLSKSNIDAADGSNNTTD